MVRSGRPDDKLRKTQKRKFSPHADPGFRSAQSGLQKGDAHAASDRFPPGMAQGTDRTSGTREGLDPSARPDRGRAACSPWVRIEKDYVFAGPQGKLTLLDLFQGRSQLYIKHFMMAPGAKHQCVGCSLEVDHVAGILPHLENHDVSYAAVARAPIEEIEVVRKRMGWTFLWVSSFGSDFNYDFNVSFRAERRCCRTRAVQFPHSARMDRNGANMSIAAFST